MTHAESGTWHFGLIARWWDEFNLPEPDELAYYRGAIERFGQPALDLGCGTGRLLRPLLAAGLDVDGVDISADMLALCARRAAEQGLTPRLVCQPMHELELERAYGTIFMCGALGIGGRRDHDREALRRVRAHLAPGGRLVFSHELPYEGATEEGWAQWLAGRRAGLPKPWRESGDRRRAADGDEIELNVRLAELDPLAQRQTFDMLARLWRDGAILEEERYSLSESLYFAQELLLMLANTGFTGVAIEGGYTGRPATPDDGNVVFVAGT